MWMDRFIAYFGLEPILIDKIDAFNPEHTTIPVYKSLQEALADNTDYHWTFIDPRGSIVLDEYEHPSVPTIYAFGSDFAGFGESIEQIGDIVRLRCPDEIYVLSVLPLVLYDRQLFLQGKRV